jgi:ubiquinone/menaquinone biosynthesis C-methylase UbiE
LDTIADLGCGDGELAFQLSGSVGAVIAIDSSRKMIDLAKKRNASNIVCVYSDVNEFNWVTGLYKLVVSFEAFHLFDKKEDLLKRVTVSLIKGGFVCIGWANYGWENLIQTDRINNIFDAFGIDWKQDWDFWSFPEFSQHMSLYQPEFSLPDIQKLEIATEMKTSQIAAYLTSTSKVSHLDKLMRMRLKQELKTELDKMVPLEKWTGTTTYNLCYSQKLV